jgi:cytosine/adenosine deaminase-related metal-dependent hydrolase
VHGLAFSDDDIRLIKQKGASVVWCADSNMFMFNKTANVQKLLDAGVNVCVGTDSPMSGGMNLLYELKYDKEVFRKLFKKELPDELLLKMVTVNPAKAFRLKKTGQIKAGYTADFTVFANKGRTPCESVIGAGLKDVMLVVINGRPAYGNREFSGIFDALKISYQKIKLDGVDKIVVGDPLGMLRRISKAVGFKKVFPFLPVEFEV